MNKFSELLKYKRVYSGTYTDDNGRLCKRYKKVRRFKLDQYGTQDHLILKIIIISILIAMAAIVISEKMTPEDVNLKVVDSYSTSD